MPVPSAITDLSATAASNSPAGTEAPSVLDDHQRAQGAFIRQLYDLVATASGSLSSAAFSTGNLAWTGTLTGGTGVVNIGSGQVYKDSSGNVGFGTTTPGAHSAKMALVASGDARLAIVDDAGNNRGGYIRSNGTDVILGTSSGVRDLVLAPDSTEAMRLTTSGHAVFSVKDTAPSLGSARQLVITRVSDTQVRLSMRGTDGTTRSVDWTLA